MNKKNELKKLEKQVIEIGVVELEEIIRRLVVNGLFEYPIINIKNGHLYSIQNDYSGNTRVFVYPYFAPKNINIPSIEIGEYKKFLRILSKGIKGKKERNNAVVVIWMDKEKELIRFVIKNLRMNGTCYYSLPYGIMDKDYVFNEKPYYFWQKIPHLAISDKSIGTHFTCPINDLRKYYGRSKEYLPSKFTVKTGDKFAGIDLGKSTGNNFYTDITANYMGWNNIETSVDYNLKPFFQTCQNPVDIYFGYHSHILFMEKTPDFEFGMLVQSNWRD